MFVGLEGSIRVCAGDRYSPFLNTNEGKKFGSDIRLLIESGDLVNIVMAPIELPPGYQDSGPLRSLL